jgi:hypothetical protein
MTRTAERAIAARGLKAEQTAPVEATPPERPPVSNKWVSTMKRIAANMKEIMANPKASKFYGGDNIRKAFIELKGEAGNREALRAAKAFTVLGQYAEMERQLAAAGRDVVAIKEGREERHTAQLQVTLQGKDASGNGIIGIYSGGLGITPAPTPDDAALTTFGKYFALAHEKSTNAKAFYQQNKAQVEKGRTIALKALRAEVGNITNYTDRTVAMQGVAELERI